MKHLLITTDSLAGRNGELDALAANGRVGVLVFEKDATGHGERLLRVLGCKALPNNACIDAFGAGIASEGNLCMSCSMVSLDSDGNVKELLEPDAEFADTISNTQIDGVNFRAAVSGKGIVLAADLPSEIIPNRCSPGFPLPQIGAASKQAKKSASVLNRLAYKLAKKHGKTLSITNKQKFTGSEGFGESFGICGRMVSADPEDSRLAKYLGMDFRMLESGSGAGSMLDGCDLLLLNVGCDGKTLQRVLEEAKGMPDVVVMVGVLESGLALVHGGGLLPGGIGVFSEPSCRRGFNMPADSFLQWVLRAVGT